MKRVLLTLAAVAAATVAAPALANEAMAKAKGCLACHTVDKKLIGPPYKDIAKKFASEPDSVDKLSAIVMKGSVGVWGKVPMPPNTTVNAAEAKQLVTWILSLK